MVDLKGGWWMVDKGRCKVASLQLAVNGVRRVKDDEHCVQVQSSILRLRRPFGIRRHRKCVRGAFEERLRCFEGAFEIRMSKTG